MKLTGAHVDKENEAAHDCCKFDLRKRRLYMYEIDKTNTASGRSRIYLYVSIIDRDLIDMKLTSGNRVGGVLSECSRSC